MPSVRSPRVRRLARKLLLLPILVAAALVAVVPAPASGPKWDDPGKGASTVEDRQPYGAGNGRKFK